MEVVNRSTVQPGEPLIEEVVLTYFSVRIAKAATSITVTRLG